MDTAYLSKLIKDSGISYKQTSNSYIFTCPRCLKKDKLYLRKKDGRFICFYCKDKENFHGKPEFALTELLHIPIHELRKILYDLPIYLPQNKHIDIEFCETEHSLMQTTSITKLYWPIDTYPINHQFSKKAADYLLFRGICLELAIQYKIRYSPNDGRVLFPVYRGKDLYGWQGRFIKNDPRVPKMISPKGFVKSNFLMFEQNLKFNEHIVVCEGPVDAMKAHLCGGNIATMGKCISRKQIEIILSYRPNKIYLALDPDAANETNRLLQEFSSINCYLMLPGEGKKDLGEMSLEEVLDKFKGAPQITTNHLCVYVKNSS